ncbi:MAG: rhodanese-like domain-containing protein [Halothiobacillaceae bacterium]
MKKHVLAFALLASLGGMSAAPLMAGDIDPASVPEIKQSDLKLYLSAKEAYAMKKADGKVIFIDVRTPEEVQYVGHAGSMLDGNVPYILNDLSGYDEKFKSYKITPNSDFTTAVEDIVTKKGGNKNSEIILMCRSGDRSSKGASLLGKVGYTKVYTVVDGFEGDKAKDGENKGKRTVNGWKNANLPWDYTMDKDKMYYVLD